MLKKSKLLVVFSMLTLVGTAGVAAARNGQGPGGPRGKALAQTFDRNQDGKLDDAERAAMRAAKEAKHAERHKQMLAQFDRNQDGKLDDAEREQAIEQKAADHFKKLDSNGDGAVSLAEFKAGVRNHHRHNRGPMGPTGPDHED
jgi:Ca2+-binding EF-hand superfamily protein